MHRLIRMIFLKVLVRLSVLFSNESDKKYENISIKIVDIDKINDTVLVRISNNGKRDFLLHNVKIVFKNSNNKELTSSLLNSDTRIKPNKSVAVKVSLFGNSKK